MEKVWIRKGNPKSVIEKDNVHYFYFPIELGLGKIRILGIEIPTPIKFPDFEPVKVVKLLGKVQAISRFHYKILTYFNNPKLVKDRVVADFSLGSHSPYIHSNDDSELGTKIAIDRLGAIETQLAQLLIMLYTHIVKGRLKMQTDLLNDYELEEAEIPREVTLDPQKCHSVVWVGKFPERCDTPSEVWHVLED